ncbi:MAG: hypothetical protein V1915_01120 [Candidatus Bathyarchaeota archaeon]
MKDHSRLLHLPTTSCILALGVIGSMFAPVVYFDRLLWLLLQLFLMGGLASNYFDEIQGRPWHTSMPTNHLWIIGTMSSFAAIIIGIYIMAMVSGWFWIFTGLWEFFTLTYNLELFEGRLHNTTCTALSWGSICLGSYFIQATTITPLILAISCITGCIAAQGRNLYETAKPFYKDKHPASSAAHRHAWAQLKTLIVFLDLNALMMLILRLMI